MNKLPKLTFYLFLLFLWFFIFPKPILAQPGDILLSDDFSDGNLDGWTVTSGNWSVDNGNLLATETGTIAFRGAIHSGNSNWDNYRIEFDVNNQSGVDEGIDFRRSDDNNYYAFNLRHGPQGLDAPLKLFKIENNNLILLQSTTNVQFLNNTWYHIKVEVLDENIKFWVNDKLILEYSDPGTSIKKGAIGVYSWTGGNGYLTARFDNVKTTELASITSPPPKLPVIFIPGIGGSELKASQDIVWSKEDGHGGTFSHAYPTDEKIWVNQNEAVKLGNDDYFDVLRLKSDGVTSEADLFLTGNLNSFGYGDIDSFFTGMGYVKGTNFFVFNYDWRKDVSTTKDDLDSLIESAKTVSGQSKINLVVHSMGGLIARYYISDSSKASKVNKLIELGVPHLGAPWAIKALMYGSQIGPSYLLGLVALNLLEVKDVAQNLTSNFELIPSTKYFNFYNNSDTIFPYPYRDDRDIDNNKETGALNFNQIKNLLSNLGHNMTVFSMGEQFHNSLDSNLNQTNNTKVYEIVGTSQPTLGQIQETWWITWPVNLIPKTDETYINGDDTVPLYSASLKNDSLDISGATKIYYVEQRHGDMPKSDGISMQTVKSILNDDNALPAEVKDQKVSLEGEQISLDDGELDLYDDQNRHCGLNDNGEIEENIPNVSCATSGKTKHAFVKKKAAKVKITTTRKSPSNISKTTAIKKRTYSQDKITKTTIYKDINIRQTGKVEFTLDPASDITPTLTSYPDAAKPDNTTIVSTSEVSGASALDQNAPATKIYTSGTKDSSGIYSGPVAITLTGTDSDSGILRIEYSLDNGQTVQIYTGPFTISTPGKTIIQIKSIDKLGNEEVPETITIEIAVPPTPTPTPVPTTSTSGSSSSNSSSSTSSQSTSEESLRNTSEVTVTSSSEVDKTQSSIFSPPAVLGINFENPHHISDQINVTGLLEQQKNSPAGFIAPFSPTQILGGLLMISGGIFTLASFGLIITFLKPFPDKM